MIKGQALSSDPYKSTNHNLSLKVVSNMINSKCHIVFGAQKMHSTLKYHNACVKPLLFLERFYTAVCSSYLLCSSTWFSKKINASWVKLQHNALLNIIVECLSLISITKINNISKKKNVPIIQLPNIIMALCFSGDVAVYVHITTLQALF